MRVCRLCPEKKPIRRAARKSSPSSRTASRRAGRLRPRSRASRRAARSAGSLVLAAETQNDQRIEPKTLSLLIEQEVEAIIYACVHTREVVLPDTLKATDIPVYLLNCHTKDNARPAVVPSEIAGGQRATNVLIDAGHTRIATITGEPYMAATGDRLTGYRRALATVDIPFDPNLVVEGDWSASAGFNGTM